MSTLVENGFLCNRKCITMPGDQFLCGFQPTFLPAGLRLPTFSTITGIIQPDYSTASQQIMRCPPHRTPSEAVLRLCVPPSKYKRERGLLEPWGTRFQSCRITAKGCLAEALSPRGVSLLPRDLIKALTIHLPGMPVMSKLHFKS